MPEGLNVWKNPPPKIRPGQDLDPKHWSEGYWLWIDEEDWEWNEETQTWDYAEGYYEFNKGNYWIFVESSNVRAIRYDGDANELYVWFSSGRIYQYQEVPEAVAIAMFFADSMGVFVHEKLKNMYGTQRLK